MILLAPPSRVGSKLAGVAVDFLDSRKPGGAQPGGQCCCCPATDNYDIIEWVEPGWA
jgi:hypothetical protein